MTVWFRDPVVGFDGSDEARVAAAWAIRHCGTDGAVHLVAVQEHPDRFTGEIFDRVWAEEMRREYPDAEVITTSVKGAEVGAGLKAEAQRVASDCVVVGARSHSLWHPRRLSPVAAWLHHHGEMAFASVRADMDLGSIVVGVDGSDEGWEALAWVTERAQPGDKIHCAWVLQELSSEYAQMPVTSGMAVLQQAIETYLKARVAEFAERSAGFLSSEVLVGFSSKDLTVAAAGADVLVVGHGHDRILDRLLDESVSRRLLQVVDEAVLVVPVTRST